MAPYEKEAFKFCMVCGSNFETVSNIEKYCSKCGYRYFISTKPSSSALVFNSKNELLLTKRSRDPYKGMWGIPAGFNDDEETFEEALIREAKEEINLDVKDYTYFKSFVGDYEYKGVIKKFISACFIIKVDDTEAANLKPGDDVAEFKWVPLAQIDYEEIGFPSVKERIKDYSNVNQAFFIHSTN